MKGYKLAESEEKFAFMNEGLRGANKIFCTFIAGRLENIY